MPKTKFGKWSAFCLGLFVVFLIVGNIIVASGQEGGDTFLDNPLISVPMSLALLFGILAFAFGLYSIVKQKERAWLVYVSSFIGLLILIFAIGELFGNE